MTNHHASFMLTALLALITIGIAPVTAEEHHQTEHHHNDVTEMTLNNGEKWIADSHTFESAETMTALVNAVPKKAKAQDLRAAGDQLHEELQSLIRGCTMTGPAHDQLHTWIEGLSPDLQSLMKAKDVKQGKASLEKVEHHLEAFDKHFQEESAK